jgi:hypothetical protein
MMNFQEEIQQNLYQQEAIYIPIKVNKNHFSHMMLKLLLGKELHNKMDVYFFYYPIFFSK